MQRIKLQKKQFGILRRSNLYLCLTHCPRCFHFFFQFFIRFRTGNTRVTSTCADALFIVPLQSCDLRSDQIYLCASRTIRIFSFSPGPPNDTYTTRCVCRHVIQFSSDIYITSHRYFHIVNKPFVRIALLNITVTSIESCLRECQYQCQCHDENSGYTSWTHIQFHDGAAKMKHRGTKTHIYYIYFQGVLSYLLYQKYLFLTDFFTNGLKNSRVEN